MKQNEALDLLMMGHNVFLTGQAGSGKTYLTNKYVKFLKKNKIGVAVTASTGIAATYLDGITVHSWSGIGIKKGITEKEISKLNSNPKVRERIQAPKVLIIDEISMFHSYRLDAVNKICKRIRSNPEPFGGMQVILCGDFFQLPPINESESPESSFAYKSDSWNELGLKICYLDEQHRQWDESYLKVLNDIRSREVDEGTFEKLSSRVSAEIENNIYPTKLYTHNVDVDAINNFELSKINKPEFDYTMVAKGNKKLIEALKKGCLAPENLILKKGAVVMFVKNNPGKSYINGTLGRVVDFDSEKYPIVETYSGKEVVAYPTSWIFEENDVILAEISQVPLRLAWAITVHKSQGMSLDAAEVDLSKSFSYGMGYVALSRLKSLDGLRLLGINQTALQVDNDIAEIDLVFKEDSRSAATKLNNLSSQELKLRQKAYLNKIFPKGDKLTSERTLKNLFNKLF